MKMKFTLIAAAVAVLGFSASAQTYVKVVETNPGLDEEKDITTCLTPSNKTSVNETDKKLPGFACQGTESHKNLLIEGEDFAHNIYGEYGPDGTTIGVYADGTKDYIRFRYNTGNKARYRSTAGSRMINALKKECHRGLNAAYIKLFVGPKPADATSDVITPKLVLAGHTDATVAGSQAAVFTFAPITLTDESQVIFYDTKDMSGDLVDNDFKDAEGANIKTLYLDLYVEGVSKDQFISFMDFGLANIAPDPVVGFNTVTTRVLGFRGDQEVLPGTIFIQAEDFDAPKAGEPLNRSTTCLGLDAQWTDAYGYPSMPSIRSFWNKGDLSQVRIDAAQNKTGYGIFQKYADGFSSQNDGLGFALCGMAKVNGDWGTIYGGEYIDETSNKITMEQAMDGFGAWFEYTFEMEEDGYVDISIAASTHNATWFQDVMTGGPSKAKPDNGYITKYQKPREEGGYEVEGLDDDFLKLYGFCYVVSFDGEDLLTNWETRPKPSPRNGQIELTTWTNPFEWSDNFEIDANGNQQNSKFLLITPPHATFDGGMQWWPLYKDEMIKEMYDMQVGTGVFEPDENGGDKEVMGESPFKKQCDEQGATYFEENYKHRPDYANVYCTAGKHTIRVKSMGGCTLFDEIRIRAHKEREKDFSGIQRVRNIIETEADAPAEYFDLQGRRVMNPANGLYIVKRGSKVTKEVIK